MPKISILIPVYNVAPYLSECIDSVINQTETDIEIICVDDASTDHSLAILTKYAEQDTRIRLLKHRDNEGLCKTRKDAVNIATGDYIMFLDSDDFLSLDACEKLYRKITHQNVDVLQFHSEILPAEGISEAMTRWVEDFMRPSEEYMEAPELVTACFIQRKFNCNLVNKIWKTEICKKAYAQIKDGHYTSAEDRYATFILTYYSRSYMGTLETFYHYRLGVGVTGGETLDINRFESRCTGAVIVENIKSFLQKQGTVSEFQKAFQAFRDDILMDCVDCWHNKLTKQDSGAGFQLLLKYWGSESVIGAIGRRYFEEQESMLSRSCLSVQANAAIYYRFVGYTAMDSIIERYISQLRSSCKELFLITDQDAPEQDESYMERPLLHIYSATDANWDDYQKRCSDLVKIIKEKNIGMLYYLSPTSHVTRLDELTILSSNAKCVICMDEYMADVVNQQEKRYHSLEQDFEVVKNKLFVLESNKFLKPVLKYLYSKNNL